MKWNGTERNGSETAMPAPEKVGLTGVVDTRAVLVVLDSVDLIAILADFGSFPFEAAATAAAAF